MMRGSAGGGTCARLASLIWRLKTPGVAQRLGRTRGLASGVQAPINENKKSHIRQKPQKQICIPVLEYFDKKYRHEHGELWDKVRAQNRFPRLLHHAERLKEYYLLNAASLLPVLALDVQDGERVLDMCAAPGGKSVAILQSATPRHFLCNDHDSLRHKWLKQTLESFVPEDLRGVTSVTNLDGRDIGPQQPQIFDKVLVDAPCSNDRSWLFSSDVLKARLRIAHTPNLPVLQKQLLRSALEALCPGGTMVYSTCTLSRAENDDVVASLLNSCDNIQTVDLTDLACSLSHSFTFAEGVQYGQLIVPEKGRTWGPMYVSKLWKTH
ncbi:tRNA (cytosine(34)-C(5))-methyltransferase, mitochondrial-like isoform X2 [Pristis pectinata]|uniref:tRNA (cytosine(34)-C(5))-methyltransferase, mitochondrial-like isoform X2 n=1 Tax=Pristis pectinata TaxID=685728 RepID=UPI00223D2618|nr:tRNA (cytosine(34)-C(5))-methyltransferase, mitochondrial-like isoform X2 [Pristis pectinata]